MTFVQLIFKNVRHGRIRLLLAILGMAAAVGALTALLSIAWNFAGSAKQSYASRKVDLVVVRAGVTERINSSLSAALESRLSALPEIAAIDGSLTEMVSVGERTMVGVPLRGLNPAGFTIGSLTVADGRTLNSNDRRQVLLGAGLARSLDAHSGQTIEIEGTSFQVAGIFQSEAALESNTAVAPLSDVQEMMDRPGRVSEFQIQVAPSVADDARLHSLCREIEALRDEAGQPLGFKAMPAREFADTDTETRLAAGMAWATSIIAMGLSLVGMTNTMLMSVLERRSELAVLRAVGWSRSRVLRMIVGESLIIAVAGAVVGAAGAYCLVRCLSQWPPTLNLVPPNLSMLAVATGIFLALAAGGAGALYPAWWATRVDPIEALRTE